MLNRIKVLCIIGITCVLLLAMTGAILAQSTITLKVGHVMGTDIARHRAMLIMESFIEKMTNNRIQIEVYPLGQLGETRELIAGLQTGAIDMAIVGGELSVVDPRLEVFELPYIFRDVDHLVRAYNSSIAKEMFDEVAEKHNIRIMSPSVSGVRYITTTNKPIYKPSDLSGVKIRVPTTKIHPVTLEAMGAVIVPMAYGEVYLALQQGVIDGQENPTPQIDSAKFYEVQNYLSKTNHIIGCTFLAMSNRVFNSLSEKDQALLMSGAELWADSNGVTIIEESEIDFKAFQSATKGVIEQFPELVDIARQMSEM